METLVGSLCPLNPQHQCQLKDFEETEINSQFPSAFGSFFCSAQREFPWEWERDLMPAFSSVLLHRLQLHLLILGLFMLVCLHSHWATAAQGQRTSPATETTLLQ